MKKIILLLLGIALIGFISVDSAYAPSVGWPYCFKDTNYSAQYQVELSSSGIIRGQAVASGSNFPAPLTGVVSGGFAFFSIGYLNNAGLRFYAIQANGLTGQTWGLSSDDSSYYDEPHSATLTQCTAVDPISESDLEGDTGAME